MQQTHLQNKTLVMLVAPSAMGKSTLIDEVLATDGRFSRVRSFTTRSPRADDKPDQFFYVSQNELQLERQAGKMITEVAFEQTGDTYGTIIGSYQSKYCILETLASSVDDYLSLPFKSTTIISIISPVEVWQSRFIDRYPQPSQAASGRLKEAVSSIEWSINYTDKRWLVNDDIAQPIAQKLINLVDQHELVDNDGSRHAHAILNLIERGVWNEKISNI